MFHLGVNFLVVLSVIFLDIGIESSSRHFYVRDDFYFILGLAWAPTLVSAALFVDFNESLISNIRKSNKLQFPTVNIRNIPRIVTGK